MEKKIWFKRKKYGWGWYPVTWQGWVILIVYLFAIVSTFINVDQDSHSGSDTLIGFALPFIVASVLLIAACRKYGEEPKWQWGDKNQE
jgi:hypothetical protein